MQKDVNKITLEKDWDFEIVLESINNELLARDQCNFLGNEKPQNDRKTIENYRRYENKRPISGATLHSSTDYRRKLTNLCLLQRES